MLNQLRGAGGGQWGEPWVQLHHAPWGSTPTVVSEAALVTSLSPELGREAHGGFFHTGQGTAIPGVPVPRESLWSPCASQSPHRCLL